MVSITDRVPSQTGVLPCIVQGDVEQHQNLQLPVSGVNTSGLDPEEQGGERETCEKTVVAESPCRRIGGGGGGGDGGVGGAGELEGGDGGGEGGDRGGGVVGGGGGEGGDVGGGGGDG